MNIEQWKQEVEFAGIYSPVNTYCKLIDCAPLGAGQDDLDFLTERIVTLSTSPHRRIPSKIVRRGRSKIVVRLS